jgi:hypothetical protein
MKVTSKQADATLAKLTSAMHRNTTLATSTESAFAAPAATYTPAPPPPPSPTPRLRSSASHNCGIRLKPSDTAKVREVIQAGLAFQQTLALSDVIRLALHAYDPRRLTEADLQRLRASDGRTAKPHAG